MTRWGSAVLERLPLAGDERVLDAGCGSGRVTELLAARLPRGRVVALDGSPAMIEAARERLAPLRRPDRVRRRRPRPAPPDGRAGRCHPLDGHLPLGPRPRRAVRQPRRRPASGRPARRAVRWRRQHRVGQARSWRRIGDGWLGPAHYETPMATIRRLDASGYVDIECWLNDEPTRFEPGEPLETYLRTVVLGAHLERLPVDERDGFVHEVAARLPEPVIDYVRLNITARRAGFADRDRRGPARPGRVERAGHLDPAPVRLGEVGLLRPVEAGDDVVRDLALEGDRPAAALRRIGLHHDRAQPGLCRPWPAGSP